MRIALILFCGLAAASCYNPDFDNDTPFQCNDPTGHYTVCPDGFHCDSNKMLCVRDDDSAGGGGTGGGGGLSIAKTGSYSGTTVAAGIPPCQEKENHSSFAKAVDVGTNTGKMKDWEICPAGNTDLFRFVVSPGNCARISLYYSINKGDLDLAIYDSNQMPTQYVDNDFTHNNACVTLNSSGTYYALVAGAYNMAVNDYEMQIEQEAPVGGVCNLDCAQVINGTP